MLLNIYLGTTVFSYFIVKLYSAACEKKLKREGYNFIKSEKSFVERVASFISVVFKCAIPVYNILNAIVIICMGDKIYDYMEEKLLEINKIYIPKDESTRISEMESSSFEKEQDNTDSVYKVNVEKKYEDMFFEEKMAYFEKQTETLTSQWPFINDESISENLSQQDHILKKTLNRKINKN